MFFSFIICQLILPFGFFLGRAESQNGREDVQSQCQRIDMRNIVKHFEPLFTLGSIPNWLFDEKFDECAQVYEAFLRKKCEFIIQQFEEFPIIKKLNSELQKTGYNRSTFCEEIGEMYATISLSEDFLLELHFKAENFTAIYKFLQDAVDLLQKQSVQVFLNVVSDSEFMPDENNSKKVMKFAEFIYYDLIHNYASVHLLKEYYKNKILRLKRLCEYKISELTYSELGHIYSHEY